VSQAKSSPCRNSAFALREFVGSVPFAAGRRVATGWRARALALALLSVLTLPGSVRADVVLDWNARAINFYKRLGAEHASEWLNYCLDTEQLTRLAQ